MAAMEYVEKTLSYLFKIALFIIVAVLFIPAYLIVTNLQSTWTKMLTDLGF